MAEYQIVEMHDSRGYVIGKRYKYKCDGCGGTAFRSIRMGNRQVLCWECRQVYAKRKRVEKEANTKREEYIRGRLG